MSSQCISIIEGYAESECAQNDHACGSSTLLRCGDLSILVDCGGPWEKDELIQALTKHDVECDRVTHVVLTHEHIDHIGNLNLFTNATIISGTGLAKPKSLYEEYDFTKGPYIIADGIEIFSTPGHSFADISVSMKDSIGQTIVIAGDVFECEDDQKDESIWKRNSLDQIKQNDSRERILNIADVIVPGHGKRFNNLSKRAN